MTVIVRVGQGYDLHRLGPGNRLMLAGVDIPHDRSLVGHSDADVVLHAIIDALLGAACLPDIGEQFPDTDTAYKGIAGALLLTRTKDLVKDQGYLPVNIDVTIIAEKPKLSPYKLDMRKRIAYILDLDLSAVNVKAKTNEGIGDLGASQAIACHALVSLTSIQKPFLSTSAKI